MKDASTMMPTHLPETLTSLLGNSLASDHQPPTTPTANTATAIPVNTEEDLLLKDLLNEPIPLQLTEEELQKVMLELSTPEKMAASRWKMI